MASRRRLGLLGRDFAIGQPLPNRFRVSRWPDLEAARNAATDAFDAHEKLPAEKLAAFVDESADRVDAAGAELAEVAERETALPAAARLGKVEVPRTSDQLRLCAKAARLGEWALPTIDAAADIRSMLVVIGRVAVFGANNFPSAFNAVIGRGRGGLALTAAAPTRRGPRRLYRRRPAGVAEAGRRASLLRQRRANPPAAGAAG